MSQLNEISVSIIIPAYNSEQFIAETLQSVISQSFINWECIVVDNGSVDKTKQIVEEFISKEKRIQYHYCEQNGVSFARNLAVKLSKGKYILPLDSDDKIESTYIEKAVKVLERKPEVKLVYCDAELFGATNRKWILPEYSFKNMLTENSIFCSALFRKSDFEKVGAYNENMKEGFEDWDFWIRFLSDGSKVYKIPEILFYYRIRKKSRNSVLDEENQLRLRRQIYLNHQTVYEKEFDLPLALYEVYLYKKQHQLLQKSPEYRIGTLLLKPVRFLKNLFSS